MTTKENEKWKIDRHIPLALIFAIVVQTCGAFWWAASVQSTLNNNTIRLGRLEALVLDINKLSEKQVRLEVQFANMEKLLNKIDLKLSK